MLFLKNKMYKSGRKAFNDSTIQKISAISHVFIDEMEENARKVMETISARITLLLVDIHKNLF